MHQGCRKAEVTKLLQCLWWEEGVERATSTALSVSGLLVIKELYRERVTLSVSKDIDQGIMTMRR